MNKQILAWWQEYGQGQYESLADLKKAIEKLRTSDDAEDTSFQRWQDTLPAISAAKAPERLKFPSIIRSENYMAQQGRADWQGVHTQVRLFAATFVLNARRMGIPLYVHTAFRHPDEQNRLNKSGNSQLKGTVAPHPQGQAVDIVHSKFHWNGTQHEEWLWLGKMGRDLAAKMKTKECEMIWGGDWDDDGVPVPKDKDEKFWDPAHWQNKHWRKHVSAVDVGTPEHFMPLEILKRGY